MKITKYEHSCWDISEGNTRVVIDPGVYSKSLQDLKNINAVVITHIHSDHFDPDVLQKIVSSNPDVQVFTTEQVSEEFTSNITVPGTNKVYTVGDTELEFFGKDHELYQGFQNIAVAINKKFFSPGDSYTQPTYEVAFAAVPASAPWLRVSEASENIKTIPARIVAPTHNALLSEIGEKIHYRILSAAANEANKEWRVIKVGESIEV